MRFGFYFLCILILGLFFEMAGPIQQAFLPGERHFFLFSDQTMQFRSIVYYLVEHLSYMLLALIVYKEVPASKLYSGAFIILEFCDAVDFMVTANGDWVVINTWPVTFNVIKVTVFTLVILYVPARSYIASKN